MARRTIDLTLTVDPSTPFSMFPRHEVFGQEEVETKIEPLRGEEWPIHRIEMSTESFTHIHVPKNLYEEGWSIDEVPVDYFVGEAAVINLRYKKPREPITAKDLEDSGVEVRDNDIVILNTGWTDKMWGTREFWVDMPYLSEEACDWLLSKHIKMLAMDTYNDLPFSEKCADCGKLHPAYKGSGNHYKFLENRVMLLEYVTNLGVLEKDRVQLVCLALKLKGVGQAPARVIAIEEK